MFIDDLVTLLVNAGVGISGTTIFWSSGAVLPTGSVPFITIQETGGMAPVLMHYSDTIPGYQRPSAQIVTRGKTWTPARALAKQAYLAFVQQRNLTINGIWYVSIDVAQEPFDLGPDESGRLRCAFNVNAMKRPS